MTRPAAEPAPRPAPATPSMDTDAPGPTRAVDEAVDALSSALATARRVAASSADNRVTQPAADAAALLAKALDTSTAQAAPTARLRVALMGRTKAGKTQLVAALSGDREPDGVGSGRHRTTRAVRATELEGFDLIDLPGVAALDGEDDTALAVATAAGADAVLWVYAESLQDTEAAELEDLLRRGKPVVVVYNAKWAVDAAGMRRVFAMHPELAFRDLTTHEERVAQIATRAGTHTPPVVAVHARAAWWAMCEGDDDLRRASRCDDLIQACDSALTARAAVLRIRARHDRPRRRLEELGGAAWLAAEQLGYEQASLSRTSQREAEALSRAVETARSDAGVRLEAAVAEARQGVRRWVRRQRRAGDDELNAAWVAYVERSGISETLDHFTDDLRDEVARCGSVARVAEIVDRQLRPSTRHRAAPDRGWRGMLRSSLRATRNAVAASVRALGVDRGIAMLFARIGGRATPVGWWLVGIDAAQGLSAGLRQELGARRVRAEEWSADRTRVCDDQLTWVRDRAASKLDEAHKATRTEIAERLDDARSALDAAVELRQVLLTTAEGAEVATVSSDRDLVAALLAHSAHPVDVVAVRRVPNKEVVVTFRGSGDRVHALALLTSHLTPETVVQSAGARRVQAGRRSSRRRKH